MIEHRARNSVFIDGRNHRRHDLEVAPRGGADEGAKLHPEQRRTVEPDAQRAPAERRIFLLDALHVRQELVAADVERAEGDRPVAGGVEDGAVELLLGAGPRKARGEHELQFGAEEADRLRPGFRQMRHVDEQPGVHVQADRDAVDADRRRVAESAILRLAPGAHARLFGISRFDIRRRPQIDLARVAVDDDRIAVLDDFGDIRDIAHRGNGERAGDDGDMARGAGLLEHQTAQPRAVVIEQRRRAHRAGDKDGVFRQFVRQQDQALASELMQQAIGDVGQVVEPIAQIRISLALQLGAGVVMDALDRGLRGQAGAHRLAQPA